MRSRFVYLLAFSLFAITTCHSQVKYDPNWESLDKRPTPQWWTDAKFGIFIHWGLYAVPSYTKVGNYSEWYWNQLAIEPANRQSNSYKVHKDVKDFHERVYGKAFSYQDFAPMFKAELFDPEQWAALFERSGAKYIVLTSKHHDGYTLWPSAEADRSWGRPWNSVDTGPQRDLLGELTDAVNETSVKMGIYFSIYEWFNPLYNTDKSLYVDKHYIPQFKDVVSRYKPAVIFSDGEWEESDKLWKSESLLAWLYNEAPNKDYVIVNDRWGKDSRHQHGGYYTTEYGAGLPNATHAWEESRGMGFSYGYNRAESIEDYNSAKALIFMLIDIVSRGGNFLLDIGPTGDGRIPVIMQERLVEMGEWLKVNGEAIYGTTTWKKTEQWSEGEQYEVKGGQYQVLDYDILKLTVSPEEGKAVKEVFFTKKGNAVYAISPKFPTGQLVIKDLQAASGARVTLLGYAQTIKWKQQGKDLVISVPNVRPGEMAVDYGFVFKVDNGK